MSLKITDPQKQVAVLNRWADDIETLLTRVTHKANTAVQQAQVASAAAATGSGVTSVGLAMPKEFTVTGSPVTSAGTLTAAWGPETTGYVFQSPPPGLTGYQGSSYATFLSIIGGGTMSVTQAPTTPTSFGLTWTNGGSNLSLPVGWTQIGGTNGFGFRSFSGTSPITVSYTVPSQIDEEMFLSLFNGPAPTVVQQANTNVVNGSLNFVSNNTSGNTLVVAIRAQGFNPANPISIAMSDSNGNIYQQIVNQPFLGNDTGTNIQFQTSVWVATNSLGGANTVSWTITGAGNLNTPYIAIAEFTPFPAGNGIPFFAPLNGSIIPAINLAGSGNGGVAGILKVANGGTGVVTSTGTGSVVLSASPTLTGTLAAGTETLAGKLTNYNSIATVANGIPSELAQVNSTGLGAAVATTTLYAVPVSGAGQYRLAWNAKVTTADAVSSTLGALTITYTDPDGVVQTITAAAQSKAGVIETSDTGNSTTTVLLGLEMLLNCKASTNIQYAMAYVSNTAGAMKYNLNIRLEAL